MSLIQPSAQTASGHDVSCPIRNVASRSRKCFSFISCSSLRSSLCGHELVHQYEAQRLSVSSLCDELEACPGCLIACWDTLQPHHSGQKRNGGVDFRDQIHILSFVSLRRLYYD